MMPQLPLATRVAVARENEQANAAERSGDAHRDYAMGLMRQGLHHHAAEPFAAASDAYTEAANRRQWVHDQHSNAGIPDPLDHQGKIGVLRRQAAAETAHAGHAMTISSYNV